MVSTQRRKETGLPGPADSPISQTWHPASRYGGWGLLVVLALLLWLQEGRNLWAAWNESASLAHGPLIPLLAGAHLWLERDRLRRWDAAAPGGLVCLLLCAPLYVGAVWADIDFLKPLALIGLSIGGIWFLGGRETLRASLGALGLLVFMIPWPTTLIDQLAFPLQLLSAAYAALLTGMLGVPIQRDGVNLAVIAGPNLPPVYSVVVAEACSGLTSLLVLLTLGYLIAYHTPARWYWRALVIAAVVPLTLCTNAVRLTVILIAGAHHAPALAQWLHDHEGPVLIFLCSLALTALRQAILVWSHPGSPASGDKSTQEVSAASSAEISIGGDTIVALPTVDPQ